MSLNFTTFAFEIFNFVVLLWVLTRLLYRPILAGIAQRRDGIEKTIADAEKREAEAAELQRSYEARAADWEKEKAELHREFESTLEAERATRLEGLRKELDLEKERAETANGAHARATLEAAEREVADQGTRFCARLLERFASPALEHVIIEAALADLASLPPERRELIHRAFDERSSVRVLTRFPLADPERESVRQAVASLIGREVAPTFAEEASLVAGLRIELGGWSLEADLADELRAFAAAGAP